MIVGGNVFFHLKFQLSDLPLFKNADFYRFLLIVPYVTLQLNILA